MLQLKRHLLVSDSKKKYVIFPILWLTIIFFMKYGKIIDCLLCTIYFSEILFYFGLKKSFGSFDYTFVKNDLEKKLQFLKNILIFLIKFLIKFALLSYMEYLVKIFPLNFIILFHHLFYLEIFDFINLLYNFWWFGLRVTSFKHI